MYHLLDHYHLIPPVTHLRKLKEAMDPYPISSLVGTPLDRITPTSTHNPSPSTPTRLRPSSQDIEEFMNQLGNATLVNAIIDKNLNTIIANFQKDKTTEPDFENPIPLSDPSHPLFGKLPPPIGPDDSKNSLYITRGENQLPLFEDIDPNIPSSQLGAPIPPLPQNTIIQSLVLTTPHQPSFTQTKLPFLSISGAASQSTSLPISFSPHIPL